VKELFCIILQILLHNKKKIAFSTEKIRTKYAISPNLANLFETQRRCCTTRSFSKESRHSILLKRRVQGDTYRDAENEVRGILKHSPLVDFRQRILPPALIVGSRLTVTLGVRPTKPKQGALRGSLVGFRKRNSSPFFIPNFP